MSADEFADSPNWAADGVAFELATQDSGFDRSVVTLSGELDLVAADRLARCLEHAIVNVRSVVVDLRGLAFMDSAGLGVLVRAQARATKTGCRLILVRGPLQIDRLLELTGLESRFEIRDDVPIDERVRSC